MVESCLRLGLTPWVLYLWQGTVPPGMGESCPLLFILPRTAVEEGFTIWLIPRFLSLCYPLQPQAESQEQSEFLFGDFQMCILLAKLNGPCWLGPPWAVAGSPLVLKSYCSLGFCWEVLPIPASSLVCRALSHCCQSIANEFDGDLHWNLHREQVTTLGVDQWLFLLWTLQPHRNRVSNDKLQSCFRPYVNAEMQNWDVERECWTRKALVEKEERTSWAEWEYPKSMNSCSWWVQLPKSLLHLYSPHT